MPISFNNQSMRTFILYSISNEYSFKSNIKFHYRVGDRMISNTAPTDSVAFATISQLMKDIAFIKKQVNLIEDRLEFVTISIEKIESNCS